MARYGTLTADGSTDSFHINPGESIHAYGDFGGGTLTLELSIGASWYTLTDYDGSTATFSVADDATAGFDFRLSNVRLTLSGATSPDIDWTVE